VTRRVEEVLSVGDIFAVLILAQAGGYIAAVAISIVLFSSHQDPHQLSGIVEYT